MKMKQSQRTIIKVIIIAVVMCVLVAVVVFLSVGRAGGEIGFRAIIDRVENGVAYATVTEQGAVFSKKLPDSIVFDTTDLDEDLKAGDQISGCYLSGTIDGQTVRVVSVVVDE